ncbi:TraB/GumN family protein [Evansella tamaricis]|uniref:TraB/GumN family protein n=1 Tax=Evansella tamaricis TaxID=2069301 RepID=A0ABS6JIU6_9BACI|nr:TraB/GumN family protein [Evansella tamaricis]MBU9713590.1 TraB/GumN family protein [Evansella tamaricis]
MAKTVQIVIYSFILFSMIGCSQETSKELLEFEDPNLEAVIEEAVNREGEGVYEKNVDSITELNASNRSISSLEGIHYLHSLQELDLEGNDIIDLAPLLSLEELLKLNIKNNPISTATASTSEIINGLIEKGVQVSYDDPSSAAARSIPPPKGIFYKVENDSNTVYLFGSIHVGFKDLYPLHDSIETAFENADFLAVELDITDIDEMEVAQHMLEYGMYRDGQTLQDVIGENSFDTLLGLVTNFGINDEILNMLRPWAAMDLLTSIVVEEAGYSAEYGVDMYFIERASGKMDVIPLETLEDQLATYLILSDETQAEELIYTLEHFDDQIQELQNLMSIWQDGDADAILELRYLDEDASEEYQEYMSALGDNRDEKMTEKIEEFLLKDSNETLFVVVGAMHLVGEKSIVGLLLDLGYEVEAGIQ